MKPVLLQINGKHRLLSAVMGSFLLLLVLSEVVFAGDPFGLTGNWSYRETGGDVENLSTFNHSYTLNYNKEVSQFIGVNGAVRYNEHQPSTGTSSDSLNASISFDLRNDLFSSNLGVSRNQSNRDDAASTYTDTLGGTFYTLKKKWPILRLFFSASDNYDDGQPRSSDTESLTLGSSIDYNWRDFDMLYNFRNSTTEDQISGSSNETIEHLAQLRYSRSFFQNRLSIAASQQYQRNETISEITPSIGGEFLVPVTILEAFSGADDTPAFGALPANPSLIDGDAISSAGVEIATTIVAQNVAARVNFQGVSRLRVLLDQELTPALQGLLSWEVWQSIDASTWTQIVGVLPAVYQLENTRTVVLLDLLTPVNARYLKAVSRIGLISPTAVHVTELEAGDVRTTTASRVSIRSQLTNYQTEFSASYRPNEKWRVSYSMRMNQNEQAGGLNSTQVNHSVNAGYFPTERLSFSLGISENTDQTDGSAEQTSRNYAVSVSSALMKTLNLSLGYTRSETSRGEQVNSSSDNINAVIYAIIYPDLTASLSNDWSRTQGGDGNESSSFGMTLNVNARISPRFDVNLSASYVESNSSTGEVTADTVDSSTRYSLNANYRPSDVLLLSGSLTRDEEADRNTFNGNATFLATRKIQTTFGYTLSFGEEESSQYNATLNWLLNRQMSLQTNGNYQVAEDRTSWAFASTVNAKF